MSQEQLSCGDLIMMVMTAFLSHPARNTGILSNSKEKDIKDSEFDSDCIF